jgi:hypothetical protein
MGRASGDVDDWAAAWFTLKGVVVSSRQIPIGVLVTYMCPAGQAPVELVVHFSKTYPPEACPFRAVSRSQQHLIFNPRHMYFNSLKEGLCILTGVTSLHSLLRALYSEGMSACVQVLHAASHNKACCF